MKIPLFLVTCAAGLSASCSTIKIRNNTGEDLSHVSVVYDYDYGHEVAQELNQGQSVKTIKYMLTGSRHVRVFAQGEKIYEMSKKLVPFSSLNVELNSKTVRK